MSQPTSPNRDSPFQKVTIVRLGKVYRAVVVTVAGPLGEVRGILENGTYAASRNSPEENGVTWIRGHHDYDSAEVKALLAANALEDEKERDQYPPIPAHSNPFQVPPFQSPAVITTDRTTEAHFRNVFDDED